MTNRWELQHSAITINTENSTVHSKNKKEKKNEI